MTIMIEEERASKGAGWASVRTERVSDEAGMASEAVRFS